MKTATATALKPPAPLPARRGILLAIALLGVAPVLLSSLLYYVRPLAGGNSYGELVARPFPLTVAQGRWVLAAYAPAPCDAACAVRLDALRRLRLAQGEEAARIDMVWLTDRAEAEAAVAGMRALHLPDPARLAALSDTIDPAGDTYLIDPHGNLVLRYPAGADMRRVIREVGRILKNNRGLG